jgi:hypothetical protein
VAEEDTGGNGTVLPTCGEDQIEVQEPVAPASVLIVMDRSGSMEGEKWDQTQAAIGQVLEVHGPYIEFGLMMFPKEKGGCSLPALPDVPFALNNGPTIVDAMKAIGTGGNTPTGGALEAALGVFAQTQTTGQKVLIVATDGKPNCAQDCGKCGCAFGCDFLCFNEDACAEGEVFDAVKSMSQQGIPTYVVGIAGSGEAKDTLNEMAELGGTALPGAVKYYDTANGGDLATALESIAGSVGSCSVQLTIPPGTAFIVVDVNGTKVKHDLEHTDGWDLLEDDVLQFYGPACEAAGAEGAAVSVTYVCKYRN